MERLNYFNPYQSKAGHYEDQLTRAYLVLLKHSFHSFVAFYDYCKSKQTIDLTKSEKEFQLIDFLEDGWDFQTQKGNPLIETNWLLSVLITDKAIKASTETVQSSERNARYDGLINFGKNLTIIIENKPRSENVWIGQLNPTVDNLSPETKVFSQPVILEWKEIIKQLNHLLSIPTSSGYEKLMIEDFLAYIDVQFPFLNPFDSFHQCKGNTELILRRINNVLKSIVIDENLVKYHHRWGFYIETPYPQIHEIGLILGTKEKEWWLELSLYYGDTQSQAISFYKSNPDISNLAGSDWALYGNFHFSFMTTNLVWFKTENYSKYLKYWLKNTDLMYQHSREEIPARIKGLSNAGIIESTPETEVTMNEKFYSKGYKTLNICPGFGLIYELSAEEAERLDKNKELRELLMTKIKEGLSVVNLNPDLILKSK